MVNKKTANCFFYREFLDSAESRVIDQTNSKGAADVLLDAGSTFIFAYFVKWNGMVVTMTFSFKMSKVRKIQPV